MADAKKQFNLSFNSQFNEQFNRDFAKQQALLEMNPRFLRTKQSIEAERRDPTINKQSSGTQFELNPYPMWQEDTLKPNEIREEAFGHQTVGKNLLNQLFLSPENIELVQTRIKYAVYVASGKKHIISRQDDTELAVVMRSIYLQYGKNIPVGIKEQIEDLNDIVVQECTSKIMSQIEQHIAYLRDKSSQPMPLSLPVFTSTIGTKQLPSVTSTFYI